MQFTQTPLLLDKGRSARRSQPNDYATSFHEKKKMARQFLDWTKTSRDINLDTIQIGIYVTRCSLQVHFEGCCCLSQALEATKQATFRVPHHILGYKQARRWSKTFSSASGRFCTRKSSGVYVNRIYTSYNPFCQQTPTLAVLSRLQCEPRTLLYRMCGIA